MFLFFLVIPALLAVAPNPEAVLKKDKQIMEQTTSPNDEKIKELAIKIESLLHSAVIEPQYEDEYLKNTDLPQIMMENFKSRYKNFKEINKMKDFGKVNEAENGYLEPSESASVDEKDKAKLENLQRENLYSLIASYLNITDEKDKARIPAVYRDVMLNIKDYPLSYAATTSIKPVNDNLVSSIATSYKYKMVVGVLFKLLKELNFEFDGKTQKKFEGSVTVNYKCLGSEQRSFIVKVCQIKAGKLFECKNSADDVLYSTIDDGSMVWIEKGPDKNKTLIIPDMRSENQSVKLCPSDTVDFGLLEKISSKLIDEENKTVADATKKKSKKNKNKKNKK